MMVWNGGVRFVIVLSKSDFCIDVEEKRLMVEGIVLGIEVFVLLVVEDYGKVLFEIYL